MSLRTKFNAIASTLGATVKQHDGRMIGFDVDAPDGKVWDATGTHCITSATYEGKGASDYVYSDLIERMEYGLSNCEDPECEYCHPVE